jgi:hypothetical protein
MKNLNKKYASDLLKWLKNEGLVEVTIKNEDKVLSAIELTLTNYAKKAEQATEE